MFGRIKIELQDKLFSQYIRKKAKYRCVACGRFFPEGLGLTCSHYWSRIHRSTRFDEENCDALCINCHNRWGGDYRHEYEAYMKKKLGNNGYKVLMMQAHTYCKKDRKMELMKVKLLYENLR
jgi:5-methylcytosine-specific restriction endonuclease McrA